MISKKTAAAAGSLIAAFAATGALAQNVTLNFAHGFAPTHTVHAQGIAPWMACVGEKSAGTITFQEFPSGQIVKHPSAIDALNSGLTQATAIVTAYSSDKLPINGITVLPNMGETSAQMAEVWRAQIEAGGALADEFAAINAHPVLFSLLPPYQIMSTKGPIDSMDDFKGLKIRAAGGSTNLMIEAVGATAVEITTADMYVAMQRGTIDATGLTLASVKTYALQELVNAISTNASFGSGGSIVAMKKDVYDGLTAEQKTIIDDCGRMAEANLGAFGDKANEELKAEFAALGIEMFAFSPELSAQVAEALSGVGEDYVKRLEERGLPARAAYDSYVAALKK